MRKIDYHLHTAFSADSQATPRTQLLAAIAQGLEEICFTDHQDFFYPGMDFSLSAADYFSECLCLREEFKDKIKVKIGLEIGLDRDYQAEIEAFVNARDYDYVIGSIHVIHQQEFYSPAHFFDGQTKQAAHHAFFLETLACVQAFDCFDCLGHLDYICRYGPYQDKTIDVSQHQEVIDAIFHTLIDKGKGIEINTSGYQERKTSGFPDKHQVQRYYDLGGRLITVGSDAHVNQRVGQHIDDALKQCQDIGFEDVTTFTKRVRD